MKSNISDNNSKSEECKVCEEMYKQKHKYNFLWEIACVILAALVVILAFCYFSQGVVNNETTINTSEAGNQNTVEGNGGIIVGSNNSSVNQSITEKDNTPIIIISIIAGVAVLIVGGIIYAHYMAQQSKHNNKK